MSFPFTEHPDDSDRPTTINAPELGLHGAIEVEPYYGPGKVALSFLSLGHVTCLELGVDTIDALIATLQVARDTAAEFADPEEGIFVETPLIACLPDVPEDVLDTQSGPVAVHASPQQTLRGQELPAHSEPIYRAGATPWTPRPCADPPPHKGRVA